MTPLRRYFVKATLLLALLVLTSTAAAQLGGRPDSAGPWTGAPSADAGMPPTEDPCPNENPEWRDAQTVMGVPIVEDRNCEPDDPRLVAAFVKGTNNVDEATLDDLALHKDAVVKGPDLDGDGDSDVINITLEVAELNGWHLKSDVLGGEPFRIAPGIAPTFWVFAPKTTIDHTGDAFNRLVRMPSPVIRAEVGDVVTVRLENTHYFPHTIHLHGVDHPFEDANGEGNDGVPMVSETPLAPGEAREYTFTARVPGTNYYHCHVHPHVHVIMGLTTMVVVEENRSENHLQTLNVGGGAVRYSSKAVQETYDREYDLVYQDYDKELGELVASSNDPRVVEKRTHREYDATDRSPDYFLLNGRSFPYTLRESLVIVDEDERVKLRVLNGGSHLLSLHHHGHKSTATHMDGAPVPAAARTQRDVWTLSAAQRLDLDLDTTNDGINSYGPGMWFMHDHHEEAVTTDGIGPGGDITIVVYEEYLNATTGFIDPLGGKLDMLFSEAYYRGEVPVFAMLGLPGFLGEVAADTLTTTETEPPARDAAAPGALAVVAVAALAVLGLRGRWRS